MSSLNLKKKAKCFNGQTQYFEHESSVTKTKMNFSCFIPQTQVKVENCIIWLSGLTCTEDNFITKSGVQKYLANTNTMIVCPDTSPRGLDLPNEHDDYSFGSGAGFYVNATTEGYKDHYRMYDYVKDELRNLMIDNFDIKKFSIMGHSMGGHGALVIGLREKELFCAVSAFSPIVNPSECKWGKNALRGYLGEDEASWRQYDATCLLKDAQVRDDEILIDQGTDDEFLEKELLTQNFINVANEVKQKNKVRFQEGYDHSYFFISTFIEDHVNFHLKNFS